MTEHLYHGTLALFLWVLPKSWGLNYDLSGEWKPNLSWVCQLKGLSTWPWAWTYLESRTYGPEQWKVSLRQALLTPWGQTCSWTTDKPLPLKDSRSVIFCHCQRKGWVGLVWFPGSKENKYKSICTVEDWVGRRDMRGRKKVKLFSHVWLFVTPWTVAQPGSSVHVDFPDKSTGVGCHFLLQGIFPTQGSNPGLPHCRQMLYRLSHQESW